MKIAFDRRSGKKAGAISTEEGKETYLLINYNLYRILSKINYWFWLIEYICELLYDWDQNVKLNFFLN